MSIKAIVSAVRKFDSAIKTTLVTEAKNVAVAVWNTFGDGCTKEVAAEVATAIAADAPWKGTSSEAARTSEWKAFIFAVQYRIDEAVTYYKNQHPNFSRHVMFSLARELPTNADGFKAAADAVARRAEKKGSGNGAPRVATLGMGLGIIAKLETRDRKVIAFRKALAKLCAQHGISFQL